MLRRWLPYIFLSVLVLVVFGRTLAFDLLRLDDYGHLIENPAVAQFTLGKLEEIWSKPWFGLYIPVTYSVWGLESWFFGATGVAPAMGFHFSNLIFHTFNSALVFFLLRQLGFAQLPGLVAASLFAVHPLQVEVVSWVSSFREELATFWGLLFLNLGLRPNSRDATGRMVGLAVLFLFACLSKPSAVVFAPIGALLFWARGLRPRVEFFAWALIIFFVTAVAKQMQPNASVDIVPTWSQSLFVSIEALTFYVRKVAWPVGLTPDYGKNLSSLLESESYLGLIVTVLTLAFAAWGAWRKNSIAIGIATAFIALIPYLGFVPFNFQNVSVVADRYMSLSFIGLSLALASLLSFPKTQKVACALVAVLGAGAAGASFEQTSHWRNDEALYSRMLAENPQSFYALGYFGRVALDNGNTAKAIPLLRQSVDIRPTHRNAVYDLARALDLIDQNDEALVHYIRLINMDPSFAGAYAGLASLLIKTGRVAEAREAIARGLQIAPTDENLVRLEQATRRTK